MAMVINTNMGAINANRVLDATSREQTVAMERLTSGLRINKAADDAAGLAVATGMTTQIMGTDQAVRNANDGISLIQTVDGAAQEAVDLMQRIRELSLQSMNGTYNAENRAQMDEEYYQLASEIERIGSTTKFNEITLMNSAKTVDIHVGWETGSNNKIEISLINFKSDSMLYYGSVGNLGTITTVSGASRVIGLIDRELSNISTIRSKWGALQNRLDSTVSNLNNVTENISASRSRIQDADFARESASLARTQVLQQAGMSMLSQANQSSQSVLSLV